VAASGNTACAGDAITERRARPSRDIHMRAAIAGRARD
jgi:hypothetical protein